MPEWGFRSKWCCAGASAERCYIHIWCDGRTWGGVILVSCRRFGIIVLGGGWAPRSLKRAWTGGAASDQA